MTYAMVYAENRDAVGVYGSREDAIDKLAALSSCTPSFAVSSAPLTATPQGRAARRPQPGVT
jgi:hypothetical protein